MKKKSFLEEGWIPGCKKINPKYCKTCMFSHGEPPFEDLPEKAYCEIYSRDEGIQKPDEVYFDGKECEFYEKDFYHETESEL